MKITHTICIASITCAIGWFAGFYTCQHFADLTQHNLRLRTPEDKTDAVIRALRFTRAGSTNTVPFLENQLDVAVFEMGIVLAEKPRSQWTDTDVQMLKIAKRYRVDFPRESEDIGLNKRVSEIFSWVDITTNSSTQPAL